MRRVRSRISKCGPSFELIIPMFNASGLAAHELGVIDWLAPCPNPLRSAKIRNSAPGRNTGPGKNQDPLCLLEQSSEFLQIALHNLIFATIGCIVHDFLRSV